MRGEVIDSSVLVAGFVKTDKFHKLAESQIVDLYNAKKTFHSSMLASVEVVGAVGRIVGDKEGGRVQRLLNEWQRKGYLRLYELNQLRMESAQNLAIKHNLKGADAIIVQIAWELKFPMISYDNNVNKAVENL